jgi:hypothetical protein
VVTIKINVIIKSDVFIILTVIYVWNANIYNRVQSFTIVSFAC